MGRIRRYIGIDESGENPMYFVAAFSKYKEDAQQPNHKLGKRRSYHLNDDPVFDFLYTEVRPQFGLHISEATRISAIGSLLVQANLREEGDVVIIDSFGNLSRVEEGLRQYLASCGIHLNGNLHVEHSADRRFPVVNEADFIAYKLYRQNGSSGFGDRQVPFLTEDEAQVYLDTYKSTR